MNLSKKIKYFITHQFISVILNEEECHLRLDVIKKGKNIKSDETTFILGENYSLTGDIEEYFKNAIEKYKHTYISVLLNSSAQGAFSGCENEKFSSFNVDVNNVKKICVDNEWMLYASKIEINWIKDIFKNFEIDFIYSPFVILNKYIKDDKQISKTVLYILYEGHSVTIIIEKNGKFLYGSLFKLKTKSITELDKMENEENTNSIMLDELEADDIFEDIEKLDEIGNFEDIESITSPDEVKVDDMLEGLDTGFISGGNSEEIIKYLKESLKDFYNNSLYESYFVEEAKIFEYSNISYDIVDYLEKELLLDVSVKKVNILETMNELTKEEILE